MQPSDRSNLSQIGSVTCKLAMKLESEVGKVVDSVAEMVELLGACMCGENSIHT